MTGLLEARAREVLSGPVSLCLAAVGEHGLVCGRPHGAQLLDDDCLRLPLRSAHVLPVVRAVRAGSPLALVASDITDLTCFQAKGRALRLEPATDEDERYARRFLDDLLQASERVMGLERTRNLATDVDGALVMRVDEVFHQTPGKNAGARVAVRPGIPAATALVDLLGELTEHRPTTSFSRQHLEASLDGTVPPVLVTIGAGGVPNVSHLSKLELLDDETLAASRQFFRKTAENLARDPRALALTLDAHTNRSFRLRLRHQRTETEGPVFERMRARLDAIASLMGMTEVFRLVGADIFTLEEAAELPGLLEEDAA